MIRGTTPVIVLNLPMELPFDTLYGTFQQKGQTVIEKTLSDVLVEETKIAITLTQSETLALDSAEIVSIQLRGKVKRRMLLKL